MERDCNNEQEKEEEVEDQQNRDKDEEDEEHDEEHDKDDSKESWTIRQGGMFHTSPDYIDTVVGNHPIVLSEQGQ